MEKDKKNPKEKDAEDYTKIHCRMYEDEFPKKDDLVLVKLNINFQCRVGEMNEDGAYAELLEYDNIKGYLMNSEISRKRVNFVKRILKEGKEEVLRVLNIDTKKKCLDLSKKRVDAREVEEFKEKYLKSKNVHGIMKLLSVKTDREIEDLYKQFCWPLYRKYEHAYDAFKLALR